MADRWGQWTRWGLAAIALATTLGACEDDGVVVVEGGEPPPPRAVEVSYFNRAVTVTWELDPGWNEEAFRVYSKRSSDSDFFLIAEVTNCSAGLCSYTDTNIVAQVTYEYFVVAVDPATGIESSAEFSIDITVPSPTPPATPVTVAAIALDGSVFLTWSDDARGSDDFSHYRVYLESDGGLLLGETDSEGFLDLLAENGQTYRYFVSSLDSQGHESAGSVAAGATPRPDFHDEFIYSYFDVPASSGFRFQDDELANPIVGGDASGRHMRLEEDADGWWLVPGPGTEINSEAFITTALKCGLGSDLDCVDLTVAPTSGYTRQDVALFPQTTYVLRFTGNDGGLHYGAVRVTMQGFDQNGAIMIFDWAQQLQIGNPSLAPRRTVRFRAGT